MFLLTAIDGFFFRRVSARGFSLMRVAWAFFAGAYLLMQWNDVVYYYANAGILPDDLAWIVARDSWRFTLLEWVELPAGVFSLYLILLICLFCMMIGLWPRLMTIASVLLLFSFHERNPMILGGGDTLLRNIGFILMIAPGIGGFSVTRMQKQWRHWKNTRALLPFPTMPVWPWRMLLWQLIVLYGTSLWYKLLGTMWLNGTAVEATFHHPVFARWPAGVMNVLMPAAGVGDYLALFWQAAWLLLLIPRRVTDLLPRRIPRIPLKRLLIAGGVLFHGGILLLMDAGVFSFVLFTAYLGLLLDEDFAWMKRVVRHEWRVRSDADTRHSKLETSRSIAVLYDGRCGLCLRSVFILQLLDWLSCLRYADFRDADTRATEAPGLTLATLDAALHIRLDQPSAETGKPVYLTGFDAFRHMARALPALWPVLPFLWLPGAAPLGRRIYAHIADRRKRCDHKECAV